MLIPPPHPFRSAFRNFFVVVVCLTPDNEHMCSEMDFIQEKGNFHPMIIYKRPVPPDDYLQPREGHEKCIIETLHNEKKCVLSIKESNFNEKWIKIFTFSPAVSLTEKYPFFYDSAHRYHSSSRSYLIDKRLSLTDDTICS